MAVRRTWFDWTGLPPDDMPPAGPVYVQYEDGRISGPVHPDDVDWLTGDVKRWAYDEVKP